MESEEKAKYYFTTTLKSEEVILLSTYTGRRTSRMRIVNIPPEVDATWLLAALTVDLKEMFTLFQVTVAEKQNL